MPFVNRFRKTPVRTPAELSDEARLVQLLDENRTATDDEQRKAKERQIIELIDHYLRESLRPVMAKIFGPKVMNTDVPSSLRYTEMMNSFFIKVLESRPDEIWRAQTARDLRNWASTVMKNHMLDYLRRKKRGEEIMHDAIAPLYESRKRHFEKRFDDRFDGLLEVLDAWQAGPDSTLQRYATLLQRHYLDGMSWKDTAVELGVETCERDAALERLREELE